MTHSIFLIQKKKKKKTRKLVLQESQSVEILVCSVKISNLDGLNSNQVGVEILELGLFNA